MKYSILIACFLAVTACYPQQGENLRRSTWEANTFYGSVILHNPDISHLIDAHPQGLILAWNKKTFGYRDWEQRYNYPDTGFSFIIQDMDNPTLGSNYSLYAHYNFYFIKRQMQFRIGQGIAYNTNPYDKYSNFRNNAYGSAILSSTYLMLNFQKEKLWDHIGLKAGISIVHYSNANVKAPNTSTNTLALNAGIVYNLHDQGPIDYIVQEQQQAVTEPVRVNLVFRAGVNESDVINSGQYPFYIFSAYADKRLGARSAVQLGGDLFFSEFLKELIRFQSISFPELQVSPTDDYKRIGAFVGHELFINRMSIITQLGYYLYYPFDFEGKVYNRVGLKYYLGKKWFGSVTLKSHAAKAEAVEFGMGIRL